VGGPEIFRQPATRQITRQRVEGLLAPIRLHDDPQQSQQAALRPQPVLDA
jgi:hypothetical protein